MKYIINLIIIFDPENRSLSLKDDNQLTVGLSNPATRLLSELIKNNRIEMARETLIKHVWEDYGFTSSSATLSNHISELRKAFEALGGSKNILITVPRIGFKMEAEIHPETKISQQPTVVKFIDDPPPPYVSELDGNNLIEADLKKKPRRLKIAMFFPAIVLIIIVASTTLVAMTKGDEAKLIDVQDKCKIYALDDSKQATELSDGARKMLSSEKIDCTQIDRYIYYMEARPGNELFNVRFIASCTKNNNVNYKNCNNYKSVR